jgi:hypothetical protein
MRFAVRFLLPFTLLGAAAGVPRRAEAEPGLTWIARAACPPGAEERLASLLAPYQGTGTTAHVEVRPVETGVELELRLRRGEREQQRVLQAPTCALAVDAASFFLLISLSPEDPLHAGDSTGVVSTAASASSAPPAAPPPEAPPLALPPPETPPSAASEPEAPADPLDSPPLADVGEIARRVGDPPRFAIDAFASTETGALPTTLAAFGGAIAFRLHSLLRLELDGAYSLSQSSMLAAGPGGAFAVLGFGARACVPFEAEIARGRLSMRRALGVGALEIAPCVGAHVEEISGAGVKVDVRRQAQAWAWGPEVGLFLRWPLARAVAVRLGVAASTPLSRPQFVIDRVGVVDQAWPVELRVAIGPEVRF